jgi:anaerobic selenocysteine-containing dehydrogenase
VFSADVSKSLVPQQVKTTRSFCRVCTSVCGILVETVGEQVIRVRGDRDHPMSQGYTCAKGRALPAMHHDPRRIERPLMRTGGSLQPTSWEHCLDDLGARLREIIERDGPSAVGIFFGSGLGMDAAGYRMAETLQRSIGTPARFSPLTIDGTAKVLTAILVGGFPGLTPQPDYERASLVVYLGVNPVVSHGHSAGMPSPISTVRSLREHAEVWVVDPRRTETARLASRHIAPRPGTDYAILAYLVRDLLREGADPDVLGHRAVGGDELRAAVEPYTLEHSARLADVADDQLAALAQAIRRAGRLAIDTGTGITMSADANVVQWLAWALMILTDSMNRPGGVWFHPGFFRQLDAAPTRALPLERIFGPGPPSRPELSGFLGEWPCAALPSEIAAGNIRAVLNLGGSLLTAFPDERVLCPALAQLDVLATTDIIENETTALSTHLLPTKDQLERADTSLWDFMSLRVAGQYTPPVVEPVGERRSTWWVLAELGRRLGHQQAGVLPSDDGQASDDAMLAVQTSRARCTFADLAARRYVETSCPLPAPWVEDHLQRFGGWRLAPPQLVAQLAALAPPPPLCLVPRRQKRHLNSQLMFLGDAAEVLLHPDDAASAGVADGEAVIVRSASGELTGTARVDRGMRRGAVSVPHGHSGANVNLLTSHQEADPLTGMALYSGVQVSVHPAVTT